MKKILCLLLILVGFLQTDQLRADNDCEDSPSFCDQSSSCKEEETFCSLAFLRGLNAEFRFAAFYPLNRRVRRIYKDILPSYELELSTTFCDCWQAWWDVGYVESWGRSRCACFRNRTELQLIPVSLGFKYLLAFDCLPCVDFYVGAGVAYSYLRIKDHSHFVNRDVTGKNVGGVAKVGFYYNITECFFFEGFFDYLYQRFSFSRHCSSTGFVERHDLNMSGLKWGVGIGMRY